MNRIRVLLVESSSLTRQTLSRLLGRDLDLEVVAATATGRLALSHLNELNPDLVLLDIAGPEKEGLITLKAIRGTHPRLPVVIFSALTERGSQTTVDALLLGASDYLKKPESKVDFELCVQNELISKIKSLIAANRITPGRNPAPSRQEGKSSVPHIDQPVAQIAPSIPSVARRASPPAQIVAIATSTGGPNALASLLSALPSSFTTPIVVVQHMAAGFTSTLSESLRRQTGRNVREVDSVQPLNAASVWLAPGGRHLVLIQQGAAIQVAPLDAPPENSCCPSADVLFRSVVEIYGPRCLAVVLTGMGYDGLAGCRAIRQAGGTILVQDQASSIAWGMPGQVATAGLADLVLPLIDLPQEIQRRTAHTK